MSYLPIGYRFRPTDVELVVNYLASKIMGQPLPCECIPVMDLYSGDPWMILHNNQTHWDETDCDVKGNVTQITTYLFTQLTPKKKVVANKKQAHGDDNNDKTRENYIRTAGCGTWRPQNCKDVFNRQGQLVGFKRYLTFETNKKKFNTKNPSTPLPSGHHYTMHEFSLARGESTFVLCQISLFFKTGKTSTASFYDRQVSCVNEDDITRVSKRVRAVDDHPLVSQVTSIPVEEGDRGGTSFSGDCDEEISRVRKRARPLEDHQFGSDAAGGDHQLIPQVTSIPTAETISPTISQEQPADDDDNEWHMLMQQICFDEALETNLSVAESSTAATSVEEVAHNDCGNTQAQPPLITEEGYHDIASTSSGGSSIVVVDVGGGCGGEEESGEPWADYNSMGRYVVDQCNPDEFVEMIEEHSNTVQVQLPINIAPGDHHVGDGTASCRR